jgi:hypothetical protein
MKSKTKTPVKNNGPERFVYIQANAVQPPKTRASGRLVRQPYPGGYVVVGMYESLGKTFTTHQAAVKWATDNGYQIRFSKPLRNERA